MNIKHKPAKTMNVMWLHVVNALEKPNNAIHCLLYSLGRFSESQMKMDICL